jgi:hypothetical protein
MTSTGTRHAYAPLFDDTDLVALAERRGYQNSEEWARAVASCRGDRRIPKCATSEDIAAKLIHDQQFVDLSERYDPIETTVDSHLAPCRLTVTERLLIAAAFAGGVGMALAAYVS